MISSGSSAAGSGGDARAEEVITMTDITPVLVVQSVVAAAVYSVAFYAKNHQKHGESFNARKAAPTILVGIGVGLAYALSGVSPSEGMVVLQLTELGGIIVLVQVLLQTILASVTTGRTEYAGDPR